MKVGANAFTMFDEHLVMLDSPHSTAVNTQYLVPVMFGHVILKLITVGAPWVPRQLEAGFDMSRLNNRKIDAEIADALVAGKERRVWDDDPKGLGLRIKPTGTATYFIQYRSPETYRKVRHTLGQHGRLTLDQARKKAKSLLGRITDGADPAHEKEAAAQAAREALTISQFCDDYLKDAKAGIVTYRGKTKKASTLAIDNGRIERHIKPTIGHKLVKDITSHDIEGAMDDIRLGKTAVDVKTGPRGRARVTGGAGTARRTITLLGGILSYAIKRGIRTDNPVRSVDLPPDGKRTKALEPDEYRKFGDALRELPGRGVNKSALKALHIIALTGCRKGEVTNLKKDEIDVSSSCFRFEDTKTGAQIRPIGSAAIDALQNIKCTEGEYVFPARSGEGGLDGKKVFREVFATAKLKGVTAHVLRHSYASVALGLGYSELTIAGLIGHSIGSVTGRYTHHVDRSLVAAADKVSATISERMFGKEQSSNVTKLPGTKARA